MIFVAFLCSVYGEAEESAPRIFRDAELYGPLRAAGQVPHPCTPKRANPARFGGPALRLAWARLWGFGMACRWGRSLARQRVLSDIRDIPRAKAQH
jgi:hypothetical protein